MSQGLHTRLVALASISALALLATALPVRVDVTALSADIAVAEAKGGGGGGDGGSGGGNSAGQGHGGQGAAADPSGHGHGRGDGVGLGHDKGEAHGRDKGQTAAADRGRGAVASSLGKLNAAHASPTALSRANPRSTVGMIAAYRDAVQNNTVTTVAQAQAALGKISNKSVNTDVVNAVNDLLGVGPLGGTAN